MNCTDGVVEILMAWLTRSRYNLRQHKARTSALRQITNLLNDQTPLDDFAKLSWDIENEPPASDSNLENLDLVK